MPSPHPLGAGIAGRAVSPCSEVHLPARQQEPDRQPEEPGSKIDGDGSPDQGDAVVTDQVRDHHAPGIGKLQQIAVFGKLAADRRAPRQDHLLRLEQFKHEDHASGSVWVAAIFWGGEAEDDPVGRAGDRLGRLLAGPGDVQDTELLKTGLQIRCGEAEQDADTEIARVEEGALVSRRRVQPVHPGRIPRLCSGEFDFQVLGENGPV